MILDTSAIVSILNQEDDAARFAAAIEGAPTVAVSAGTILEAALVLGRTRGEALDAFLSLVGVSVVPVGSEHLQSARGAWERYGRGSGSKARLNYGDCFSYAAARVAGQPLLFKGDDFTHTDIASAL
ncbi:MAG: type II toxin-antitoxin system VapC family toxin [Dermatophilaceae bacterium]